MGSVPDFGTTKHTNYTKIKTGVESGRAAGALVVWSLVDHT